MITFVCYIGVEFWFGLLVCVCYIRDFVIPGCFILGYCSIHFTVSLARLKDIVRFTGDFVKSGLHCTLF